MRRFSSEKDRTASTQHPGQGLAPPFRCGACQRDRSATGRRLRLVAGLKTWGCVACADIGARPVKYEPRPPSKGGRTDPRPHIIEELRKCGEAGALGPDIATAIGRDKDNVATRLSELHELGVVGWWPDPIGRCVNRRRYWLAEFRPVKRPPATGIRSGLADIKEQHIGMGWRKVAPQPVQRADGVVVVPGWTHDHRYQMAPGEKVVGGFASLGLGRYLEDARP